MRHLRSASVQTALALLLAAIPTAHAWAESVRLGAAPTSAPATLVASDDPDQAAMSVGDLVVEFPRDLARQPLVVRHAGAEPLAFTATAAVARDEAGTERTRWQPRAAEAAYDDNVVVYAGVFPGMDARYTVFQDHVKHDLRLAHAPALPAGAAWFGLKSSMQLPAGYSVKRLFMLDELAPGLADAVQVLDANGEVAYTLPQVIARDAEGRTRVGRWQVADTGEGAVALTAEVDTKWLQQAAYPVDLDPTVFLAVGQTWVSVYPWDFSMAVDPNATVPLASRSFQSIYAASMFGASTGYITEIGWQCNGTTGLSFQRIRVTIGEAQPNAYQAPQLSFAANFFGTPTVVFDGPATLSAFSGDFTRLRLTDYYNYTAGPLAILVELFDLPTGGGTSYFIAQDPINPGAPWEAMLVLNDNQTSPSGMASVAWGLAMQVEMRAFYIDDDSVPAAYTNAPYSHTFSTGGTTTGGTWSATGLPPGFAIDPTTGELAATAIDPNDVGDYEIEVTLTVNNESHARLYDLVVANPPSIVTTQLPDAAVNVPYSFSIQATGGGQPYSWAIIAGSLPSGLSLDASTGAITGTPAIGQDGSYSIEVEVTDTGNLTASQPLDLEVSPPVEIASTPLQDATDGLAYSFAIATVGGSGQFTFSIVGGSLPPSLTLDPDTGTVSGSVDFGSEENSPYTFNVQVVDQLSGDSDSKELELVVQQLPQIDTEEFQNVPLRSGQQWGPYELKVIGGAAPFQFIVLNLPPGLDFDEQASEIGGVVGQIGQNDEFNTRIIAVDANGAITAAVVTLRGPISVESSGGCGAMPNGTAFALAASLALALGMLALVRRRIS